MLARADGLDFRTDRCVASGFQVLQLRVLLHVLFSERVVITAERVSIWAVATN